MNIYNHNRSILGTPFLNRCQSVVLPKKDNVDTGCSINWPSVGGASAYKLTIATDASFIHAIDGYNVLTVTTTSINITTLTPYTKYFVQLVAIDGQTNSAAATDNFMTLDADGLVILPWDSNNLHAFDARNGNVKWIFTGAHLFATPIIQDSVVYVDSNDGRLYA